MLVLVAQSVLRRSTDLTDSALLLLLTVLQVRSAKSIAGAKDKGSAGLPEDAFAMSAGGQSVP